MRERDETQKIEKRSEENSLKAGSLTEIRSRGRGYGSEEP